jgi:Predicted hydrolase of the alpha/beta superfamily
MKKIFIIMALMASYISHSESTYSINWNLESNYLKSDRKITIQLPQSYYSQTKYKYPVLYLLDGDNNLNYTQSVAEFLADNGEIPELIIVAITSGVHRSSDYLPINPQTGDSNRGAEAFLNFITAELMPKVANEFRAAPFKIISGHSYGGVFVAYAFINGTNHFNAYISQSPYFDETMGAPLTNEIKSTLNENKQNKIYYFANLGDEPNLASGFEKLETIFNQDNFKRHRLIIKKEPQKSHMTTRLVGQYDGLEQLFKKDWILSNKSLVQNKYKALLKHIEKLSKMYDYQVLYNEKYFATATQIFLSMQDAESAHKTSELYKKQYPQSVLAHYMSANVYATLKDNPMH